MRLIRGLHNFPNVFKPCIATIGNFDGVHLGHQNILHSLTQQAQQLQLSSVVITFEPTPKEFFQSEQAPARLSRLREKLTLLSEFKIDHMLCILFNKSFAALSATQFIEDVLIQKLAVQSLIVGDDFRFGHQRQGDASLLKRIGQAHGMRVQVLSECAVQQQRVTSTQIRQLLWEGNLTQAAQLLGRNYSLWGRVAHGQQRGRTIGFPTANLYLHRHKSPLHGVFAVRIHHARYGVLQGVANIGNRPTVDGSRTLLEIHIFNFSELIYGQQLQIEFLHKLRDEQKFASFEALKQQIILDAETARAYFAELNLPC